MDKRKKNLKKIVELSKSIRQKYMNMKQGFAETEQALKETFKPIVTPLETLIQQRKKDEEEEELIQPFSKRKKKDIDEWDKNLKRKLLKEEDEDQDEEKPIKKLKRKMMKKEKEEEEEEMESTDLEEEEDEKTTTSIAQKESPKFLKMETVSKTEPELSVEELLTDYIINEEGQEQMKFVLEKFGNIAGPYILLYGLNDKSIDKSTRGVRFSGNRWMIGDAIIKIDNNDLFLKPGAANLSPEDEYHSSDMDVDDSETDSSNWYEGTSGLYELLFMKDPDSSKVTENDILRYNEILRKTNAIKQHYSFDKKNQGSKTIKYRTYVKDYQKSQKRTIKKKSSSSPLKRKKTGSNYKDYIVARPELVYFDDVNELVERLKLLIASQQSGNTGHKNEILSILEELREAGIIE